MPNRKQDQGEFSELIPDPNRGGWYYPGHSNCGQVCCPNLADDHYNQEHAQEHRMPKKYEGYWSQQNPQCYSNRLAQHRSHLWWNDKGKNLAK